MSILSRLFPKHDAGTTPAGGTPIPTSEGAAAAQPGEAEPTPIDPPPPAAAPAPLPPPVRTTGQTAVVETRNTPRTDLRVSDKTPGSKKSGAPKDTVKDHPKDNAQRLRTTLIGRATPPADAAPARRGHTNPRREKPADEPAAAAAAQAADDIDAAVAAAVAQLVDSPTLVTPAGAPAKPLTSATLPPPRLAPAAPVQAAPAPVAASAGGPTTTVPPWTPADRAATRATFEELSHEHARPVRNLMLELEWGGPAAAWMVAARGALASLRRMADQVELTEVAAAISTFLALLDQAIVDGVLSEDVARRLQGAYPALGQSLPRAFELGGERDRREPIMVQSLLGQVPGLEPLMVQRLFAVGLGRLDSLLRATAEEVAVVADLPGPVAGALVAEAQELRRSGGNQPQLTDPSRIVGPLLATLKRQHGEYTHAALGWTVDNLAAKRHHRRQRERTFLKIRMAVTRLGDVDFALRLQTYSYARRIDELDQYLQQAGGLARAS